MAWQPPTYKPLVTPLGNVYKINVCLLFAAELEKEVVCLIKNRPGELH